MGRKRDPKSVMGRIRGLVVGAAKEFRRPAGRSLRQWQSHISATISFLRRKQNIPARFSTHQTHDGVRVTRVE